MDDKPFRKSRQKTKGIQGKRSADHLNQKTKWMKPLIRLGSSEKGMRIVTSALTMLLVIAMVLLLPALFQRAQLGWTSLAHAAAGPTPTPTTEPVQLPSEVLQPLEGVTRLAISKTTIPSRPREDVVKYTVQTGDTVFAIADKYGLKPSTILFGNKATLENDVDLLRPGQELNILPLDGVYYQWQGSETLTGVAKFYHVDPQAIIDYPANNLNPDSLGDLSHPNIPKGTWLIVPGGSYVFYWNAPIASRDGPPVNAKVVGAGYCGAVSGGPIGYGTFIWPTTEHWLSGTDYRPDVGHYGVDFAGALGNAVYAADAGVIVYAGWNDWGYGNLIIVDHGNGWQSYYAHLSQINVSCGQGVGQGDVIGLIGATGHATGPHLHFELKYNGAPVNPHTVYDIPSR